MSDPAAKPTTGSGKTAPGTTDELAVCNAQEDAESSNEKLLVVGPAGASKTTQIATLPGRKFVYFFDPNGKRAIRGHNIDYIEIVPEPSEVDWTIKGFNKDSLSDKPKKAKEPLVYRRWEDDLNRRYDTGFFDQYNWLIIDSISLLVKAVMNRILFLNKRYGDVEDLSDYRVAGNKLSEIFVPITSLRNLNLYCTGHIIDRTNETTKRISTELDVPGAARSLLPKMFSHILETRAVRGDSQQYVLLTRSDPRGFQGLRCAFHNVDPEIDITISDFTKPEDFGIGAFLARNSSMMNSLRSDGKNVPPAKQQAAKPGQAKPAAQPAKPAVSSPSTNQQR